MILNGFIWVDVGLDFEGLIMKGGGILDERRLLLRQAVPGFTVSGFGIGIYMIL